MSSTSRADLRLFVCGDDEHLHGGTVRRDEALDVVCGVVAVLVYLDAEGLEAAEDRPAGVRVVLADASRHDNRIHARQLEGVGADHAADREQEDVVGELRLLIAMADDLLEVAQVARGPGDAQKARLAVEDPVHLVRAQMLLLHDGRDDGGVNRARARVHHDAVERRVAHRGVHAVAVVDGADRRARAQMAGNHLERAQVLPQKLGGAARHVLVRDAVEAELADVVLLVITVRDRVDVGATRHRLVEGGVECGHLHSARHELLAALDDPQCIGVVERRELGVLPDDVDNVPVDDNRAVERVSAVGDAVPDGVDFGELLERRAGKLGERLHDEVHGLVVGLCLDRAKRPARLVDIDEVGVVRADVLDHALAQRFALGQHRAIDGLHHHIRIEQLVLERARARVENEDFHRARLSISSR